MSIASRVTCPVSLRPGAQGAPASLRYALPFAVSLDAPGSWKNHIEPLLIYHPPLTMSDS